MGNNKCYWFYFINKKIQVETLDVGISDLYHGFMPFHSIMLPLEKRKKVLFYSFNSPAVMIKLNVSYDWVWYSDYFNCFDWLRKIWSLLPLWGSTSQENHHCTEVRPAGFKNWLLHQLEFIHLSEPSIPQLKNYNSTHITEWLLQSNEMYKSMISNIKF